jgi:hypothetical protein
MIIYSSAVIPKPQLPPFNISMLFADEYGHMSYQRILGVEFVTSGNVHSIQDMLSEQTVSYVAVDFTPLLPYSKDTPFLKTLADMTRTHKTVQTRSLRPAAHKNPRAGARWR